MSLGALITKSRTSARLSIEDLSKITNIPVSLLREMEDDNLHKCGGETYARGHLRNIAAKLDVDERVFLDLFESEVTAPAKPIRDLLSENNAALPYQERKQVSWKVLAGVSIAALVLFGGAQVIFSNLNSGSDPVAVASPSTSASASASESATPVETATPKPSATEVSSTVTEVEGELVVKVSATRGPTWLYVSNQDGTSIFSGQIRKGNSKEFSASEELNLRVGNAGGVDITLNGENVGPIGANREVVNLTYNVK